MAASALLLAAALALPAAARDAGTVGSDSFCDGEDGRWCLRRVDLGPVLVIDEIDVKHSSATTLVLVHDEKDKKLAEALKTGLSARESSAAYWNAIYDDPVKDRERRLKRGEELKKANTAAARREKEARDSGLPPPPLEPPLDEALPNPYELFAEPDTVVYTLDEWKVYLAKGDRVGERRRKLLETLAADKTDRLSSLERKPAASRNKGERLEQFVEEMKEPYTREILEDYRADLTGRFAVVYRHRPPTGGAWRRWSASAPAAPTPPLALAPEPSKPHAWVEPCASTETRTVAWLVDLLMKRGSEAREIFGKLRGKPSKELMIPGNLTKDGVTYSADVILDKSRKPASLSFYTLPTFNQKPGARSWFLATDLAGRLKEFQAADDQTHKKLDVSEPEALAELDRALAVFCVKR